MRETLRNDLLLWTRAHSRQQGRRLRERAKNLWQDVRQKPLVQAALLLASLAVLLSTLFWLLLNFLSAAVAALTALFVLERVFGIRFQPPAWV